MSLTSQIADLVTATNTLTARVEELLNTINSTVEDRVQAAIEAENITGKVSGIVNSMIEAGDIGTPDAQTLGGHAITDFVLKTDAIDLGGL